MLSIICTTNYFIEYLLYTKFQIAINIVGSYCIILLLLKVRGIYIQKWRILKFHLSWFIMYFMCTATLVMCNKCVISALVDLKSTIHSVIDLSQTTMRFLRQLLLSSPGFYHGTLIVHSYHRNYLEKHKTFLCQG